MTTTPILADRILNEALDSTLLAELREKIDEPETANMIMTSILSSLHSSNTAIKSVGVAMERMEAIAESDTEIACCLMAHLWGAASQVDGAFDVCDSIDLWITNCRSPIVDTQLRFLAEFPNDRGIREHFRSMTDM